MPHEGFGAGLYIHRLSKKVTGLPEAKNSQAFIDVFHPGEYLVLTSLIAMLKDPRIAKLLPDIDIGTLEKRKLAAEASRNYFNVYGHEF
jgi:hypothetical protein